MTTFDLYLEDHHLMLRDMVREFAEAEIAPVAAGLDDREEFPWDNAAKMAELGLFGIPWPEEYGAAGMDLMASVIVAEEPSAIETATVRPAPRAPTPLNTSTLRCLHIAAMPPTKPSTMPCLRCCVRANSTVASPLSMPNSLEWSTCRFTAAVSRNAFAGMQPRLRHVPPNASFSTRATFSPADAPYNAAE